MQLARRAPLAFLLAALVSSSLAGCGNALGSQDLAAAGASAAFGKLSGGLGDGPVSLFVEPQAGDAPIVNAIDQAQQSVAVEVYILTDPAIENALVQAQQRGVNVQVMLDPSPYIPAGSGAPFNINQATFNSLQNAGVDVQWSNPAFTYTHAKFMVVDDQTALICTANFSKAAFSTNREFGAIDTNAQDVEDLNQLFAADWARTNFVPTAPNLVVSPTNSRTKLENLLSGAHRTIAIEDEEFSDPEAISLLGQLSKAGVQVEVILAAPSDVSANTASAQQLQAAGVTVHYLQAPVVHAKLIVADNQTAYIGSVNLSTNSMANNREVGLLTADPGDVSTLASTFASDWSHSVPFPGASSIVPLGGGSPQ
ncbi:MAG: hypothetical protein KGR26_06050 [Cyanobacteria bacterium REEB65]|nr:hypothetical protein [Cyanobacteria bacterium REEB65]